MYLAYLWYILRHKWFVFLECCKLGIPWLGLTHDLSKFSKIERVAYAHCFFNPDGSKRDVRDKTGFYDPSKFDGFEGAWNNHQKHNKHHWQYWVCIHVTGEPKLLPFPDKYRHEMLADMRGASRALGFGVSINAYYEKNKDNMQLHPDTRKWLERMLGLETVNVMEATADVEEVS